MSEVCDDTTVETRIERYADQGRCVTHLDGRVVFVRFALPGELVRISLDVPHNRKSRFLTGEVVEVLEPSSHRVAPPWPLAGPLAQGGGVGGADLIHVDIAGQLEWKSCLITEQLRRLGHIDIDEVPVFSAPGDAALAGLHWRTRIDLIADEQGRASMRRRGSHERVALDTMPLATRALLEIAENTAVWSHDFVPGSGIRITVPEPQGIDTTHAEPPALLDAVGQNMAVISDGEVLAGNPKVSERLEVAGKQFDYVVDAAGFWQVHREAPRLLVEHVLAAVLSRLPSSLAKPVIWDLYSGSGLFTLPLAQLVGGARVLSIEGERKAVANASHNIAQSGLTNVTALTGDVHRTLRSLPQAYSHPNVVVLDPPRAGANAQVCQSVADAEPKLIVYVACNPTSLARDAATVTHLGYHVDEVHALDIYPMTHHVETVAVFVRETGGRS